MSIIADVTTILTKVGISFETGHYSGVPPDTYAVIIPLGDSYDLAADNQPQADIQEASIAIYSKTNPYPLRDDIAKSLLVADFTITDRRYIGFESSTKYHHLIVDVQKLYTLFPQVCECKHSTTNLEKNCEME